MADSIESKPLIGRKAVNNRDIPYICNIKYIKRDILSLEERIKWERARMRSISQHLSGMPGGGGSKCGLDGAFAAISALEDRHEQMVKQYAKDAARVDRIICEIRSEQLKAMVTMLYLEQKSDSETRKELGLSRWNFDIAKKAIEDAPDMASIVWHDRYCYTDDRDKTV